jgi:CBS domain containing-hemolysin-like protein
MDFAWQIVIIVFLIFISGFLSACETALTGVNRIRLKHKAEKSPSAKKALRLLEKYDQVLATILIANNAIAVIAASIATVLAVHLSLTYENIEETLAVTIASAIVTVVLIILADILPKTLAREHADYFAVISAGILTVIVWLLIPVSFIMLLLQRAVVRIFARDEKSVSVTEQELLQIIDEIEDEGVLEEHESDLVRSALEFDETTVEEIMTPRVDIIAVALTDSAAEVRSVFFAEGYSRLPVYDGNPDKIVGLLSSKKFLKWLAEFENADDAENADLPVQDIVRLPALMKLSDALKFMQRKKTHLAVVLDQYGGTAGIVTLEDILEELVGEIWDESDEETQPVKLIKDGVFEVDGELSVNDFNRYFEDKPPGEVIKIESESKTIGGWGFEVFGKIPNVGESVNSPRAEKGESSKIKITVLNMDGRRIERLRLEVVR